MMFFQERRTQPRIFTFLLLHKETCGVFVILMFMSENFAGKLLERNRVGALLRIFANKPESVDMVVASGLSALRRLLSLRTEGRPTFSRIDFLVSSDPAYDDTDCGQTAERLRKEIAEHFPQAAVNVLEIKRGDIYCMLLNYGVVNQLEDRVPYSVILSHNVASYATQENVDALLTAMYHKARVAGIAIKEISPLVTRGVVANTFAIWHNKSLMTVGGFDLAAAKPTRAHAHAHDRLIGWSEQKALRHGDGKVEFHAAGCEEVIPLVRFAKYFGKSIAVINPKGEGMEWTEFDEKTDSVAYHRHLAKLATKKERQERMAATQGVTLEFIQEGMIKPL